MLPLENLTRKADMDGGRQRTAKPGIQTRWAPNPVLGPSSWGGGPAPLTATQVGSVSFHAPDSKSQARASLWQSPGHTPDRDGDGSCGVGTSSDTGCAADAEEPPTRLPAA